MSVYYTLVGYACGAVTMYVIMRRKIVRALDELKRKIREDMGPKS